MRSDDVEVMRAMSPNRRTTPSITKPTAREGHGGTDRGDAACKDSGSWTDWPRMSSASPPRPGSRGWCASTGATSPSWPSRLELANAIFEYLEILRNGQRRVDHDDLPPAPATEARFPRAGPFAALREVCAAKGPVT